MNGMIKRKPNERTHYEVNKLNPYWMELHFFYSQVSRVFINEDLISNYINHFNEISLRIEKGFSTRPDTLLSNGLMRTIKVYYKKKGNPEKANELAKLNNTYLNIWREIPKKK